MSDCIAHWFGWVSAWFAPRPPGRHSRAYAAGRPTTTAPDRPVAGPPPEERHAPGEPLDRAAFLLALVRPYVVAHERRQEEQRLQRRRRRALVLATVGIDVGPRWIHGVEVGR